MVQHRVTASDDTFRLDAGFVDYSIVAIYFAVVLGIGVLARRQVSTSIDFFLSGRSLPAWVTGLAFISANLGAVEIMGMSANGAQYGMATVHYFWIGAVPAMLFLGVVMMPFYYGSGVRSVPEFMRLRFGTGAHLVNALSFAIAQLLIAGINLYLLATIVNRLLGWPLWVSLVVAAAVVLSYTALGGLSAAIYNEVLQFFVIVAALLPLTILALNKVGGWDGIKERVQPGQEQLSSWPGTELTGIDEPVLSVIGIVLGLGFVLSFGYWTTNFVEVQRAMASSSISAARRAPIIGAFPKMFVPFIVIIPGIIAAIIVPELAIVQGRRRRRRHVQRRDPAADARPAAQRHARRRHRRPDGLLHGRHGGQHLRLQHGLQLRPVAAVRRQGPRGRALPVIGRVATVGATVLAIGTAWFASNYDNLMTYLQVLFGFFNAPLFATFILGMFWKRMTAAAGWTGLVAGTAAAIFVAVLSEDALGGASVGVIGLSGQGASFVAAGAAFVVDILVSVDRVRADPSAGRVRAEGPGVLAHAEGVARRPRRRRAPVVPVTDEAGRDRPGPRHRPQPHLPSRRPT